jgi:hypothetical protein
MPCRLESLALFGVDSFVDYALFLQHTNSVRLSGEQTQATRTEFFGTGSKQDGDEAVPSLQIAVPSQPAGEWCLDHSGLTASRRPEDDPFDFEPEFSWYRLFEEIKLKR